jgi:transcriptional regulator with XRE-family HTH domain
VSRSTLDNWFHGETKNPQHHTIAAVVTSLGYEETFQRTKTIELDKELEVAKRWLDKQKDLQEKFKQPRKRKQNGSARIGK